MRFLILLITLLFTLDISAQFDYLPTPGWNGNNKPTHDTLPHYVGKDSRPSRLLVNMTNKAAFGVFDTTRGAISYPVHTTATMNGLSSPPVGMGVYNSDSNKLCFFYAASWHCLSGGGGGGSAGWGLTGNSGTDSSVNFIGTTDTRQFVIRTDNQPRMTFTNDGKIGIKTDNPFNQFDVRGGTLLVSDDNIPSAFVINNSSMGNIIAYTTSMGGVDHGIEVDATQTNVRGVLRLDDGTQADNKVFMCNALGDGSWGYLDSIDALKVSSGLKVYDSQGCVIFDNTTTESAGNTIIGYPTVCGSSWTRYFKFNHEDGVMSIEANDGTSTPTTSYGLGFIQTSSAPSSFKYKHNYPLTELDTFTVEHNMFDPIPDTASAVYVASVDGVYADAKGNVQLCETGWGSYTDLTYNSTPWIPTPGSTFDTVPNDGGLTNETQLPCDLPYFYNPGTKLSASNVGDDLIMQASMKIKTTTILPTRVDVLFGDQTQSQSITVNSGSGFEQYYSFTFSVVNIGTQSWALRLRTNDDIEVRDIRYILKRTHKAR